MYTLFLGEIPSKIDKILFSSESITGGLCSMSNQKQKAEKKKKKEKEKEKEEKRKRRRRTDYGKPHLNFYILHVSI